jgi:hypothetical protein
VDRYKRVTGTKEEIVREAGKGEWTGEERMLAEGRKGVNRGKRECWLREEKVLTEGRENAG